MNQRMRLVLGLLLALVLLTTACGDGSGGGATDGATDADDPYGLQEPGVLRVGSDLDFAPFEFIEDGEEKGFDIELVNEIADRLGLEVEYVNASFDTIFTQLAGGEFDLIVSAITITDERLETIDFSDPYFAANQALVVQAGSEIGAVDDLADRDVGAQAGTTGLDYARDNFTESRIVEFPTYPAAFTALEAGQLDAVLADLPVAAEEVDGSDGALEIVEEVDTNELYGLGVQKDQDALLEAVNEQLAEIIADGTYEELYQTWFAGDVPEQFQS